MFSRVLRYVRLPLVLILIYAVLRFLMGPVFGAPYAPRGNAVFSVFGLTVISSLYFGAMSNRVGRFSWLGTLLVGVLLGLWAQILIFTATLLSYVAGLEATSYYTHWDALNVPEGTVVPMAQAMISRAVGLAAGPILPAIAALLGRLIFGPLSPRCDD
jgi:MFS family permease